MHGVGYPFLSYETFRYLFAIFLLFSGVDELLFTVVQQFGQVVVDHVNGAAVQSASRAFKNLAPLLVIADSLVSTGDYVIT